MTTPFRLRVESGPNAGQTFAIDGPGATVGRQEGNTIVLDDPRLSRRHLRLDLRDGALVATDLGSANGTLLNGVDLGDSRPLRPGDRLQLGDTTLSVEGAPPPAADSAPPAGAANAANEEARAPFSPPPPAPAVAAPHLTVEDGAGAGREYPLGHAPLTIGRQEGNGIVLDDAQVSRRHARVELRGERAVIADLGSVNGVLVNGRRIDGSQPLWPGDRIEIGATTLRFAGDAPGTPVLAGVGFEPMRDPPLVPAVGRTPAWAAPATGEPLPVVPAVPPPPIALPPPAAAPRPRGRLPLFLAGGLAALLLVCALGAGGLLLLLRPAEPVAEPAGVAASGSAVPAPTPIATPAATAPSAGGPGGTPAVAPVSLPGSAGGNAAPPPPGAAQPTATATRRQSDAGGPAAAIGVGNPEHAPPAGWTAGEGGSGRMPRVAR